MMLALGIEIDGVRFLFCVVAAESPLLAVNHDARLPFKIARIPRYAEQHRDIVDLRGAQILLILALGCSSKIADSIVRRITVDVVDMFLREYAMNVQPSKTVRLVESLIDADAAIPIRFRTAGNLPYAGATPDPYAPMEFSGIGRIFQKFTQTFLSKIGLSHDAVLSQSGQRLAGVDSTALASLF